MRQHVAVYCGIDIQCAAAEIRPGKKKKKKKKKIDR